MIEIYTIQLAKYRKLDPLGIKLIDITAKSGIEAFAPLISNVMLYKQSLLSESEYTELYLSKMRRSYKDHYDKWIEISSYSKIALACYCPAGVFCHRHLFKDIFKKHLDKKGIEFHDHGELY